MCGAQANSKCTWAQRTGGDGLGQKPRDWYICTSSRADVPVVPDLPHPLAQKNGHNRITRTATRARRPHSASLAGVNRLRTVTAAAQTRTNGVAGGATADGVLAQPVTATTQR